MTPDAEQVARRALADRRAQLIAEAKRSRPADGDVDDRTVARLAHAAAARVAAMRTTAGTPPFPRPTA